MDKNEFQTIMCNVLSAESAAIESLIHNIDWLQAKACIDLLLNCTGKVILSGCGTSGEAAKKIAHTLSCVEIPAFFLSPSDALHGGLGVVEKHDIIILISKGGKTSELDIMMDRLIMMNAQTIVVSEDPRTFLAGKATQFMQIRTEKEPDPFHMLATASTLSVIAFFDALTIVLQQETGFTKEKFLTIHPGGEVGYQLKSEIEK
ncbi:SIS domain-containing protein [Treponema parvum]|uniref:SIS domain-containing protein n=1 Tax=Treponema parvum TaxID=138851 RepID=A0A975F6J5_9SPIR|nr:SIS domain-containing protein [Treponema parvum]QTQ14844.1 SIS domain-containing protein [Treponema parvum]